MTTQQLTCPSCRKPLFLHELNNLCQAGPEAILCSNCRYKFALVVGRVVWVSVEVMQKSEGNKGTQTFERVYDFRLEMENGRMEQIKFPTSERVPELQIVPQDRLLLLYTWNAKTLSNLIQVDNITTGRRLSLNSPDKSAMNSGFIMGGLIGLLGIGVVGYELLSPKQALYVFAPSALTAGVVAYRRSRPQEKDPQIAQRLLADQKFLARRHELEQEIVKLESEKSGNGNLVDQLTSLQAKMKRHLDIYRDRVETCAKAIDVLEQQNSLLDQLLAGYQQVLDMVDIEFSTHQITDQLPQDIDSQILKRINALQELEEQKTNLAVAINPRQLLQMDVA